MDAIKPVTDYSDYSRETESAIRETAQRIHETNRRAEVRKEESENIRVQALDEKIIRQRLRRDELQEAELRKKERDRVESSMPENEPKKKNLPRIPQGPSYFLVYKIAPGFREVTVSYEENFHGNFLTANA